MTYRSSPGGAIAAETPTLYIMRSELTATPAEWELRDRIACEARFGGTIPIGRFWASDTAVAFSSGSTANCTSPADVAFGAGDWRLVLGRGSDQRLLDAQVTIDVGGRTCTYADVGGSSTIRALLSFSPSLWNGVLSNALTLAPSLDLLPSVPYTAACGAATIGVPWGQLRISPGQTIYGYPYP